MSIHSIPRAMAASLVSLVACAMAAEEAGPWRVATIHSSFNKGSYAFRQEWDATLKEMRFPFDSYENTMLGELATKLDQYDLVIASSVFNFEHTQDLREWREPFLAFLRRGGVVLITDASYDSTLEKGVCSWSPDFALRTEKASAHTRPSAATRQLALGSGAALAQAPNELLSAAQRAGHWAHMIPASSTWRQAIVDADGKPTLAWQPVGRGLLVATSHYAFGRGSRRKLGKALLENMLFMASSLRAGVELVSLDLGQLDPGLNGGEIQLRNSLTQPMPHRVVFALHRGDERVERQEMAMVVAPGGVATCTWQYRVRGRGPHRLELMVSRGESPEPAVVLRRQRDVPEIVTLFAWKRHFDRADRAASVKVELLPDQPFVALAHRLTAQAVVGGQSGRSIELPATAQEIQLPLEGLGAGIGRAEVRLLHGKVEVARASLPIQVVAAPYVRIMPDRSCQVAGRPFFPIGMYIVSWRLPDTAAILTKMQEIAAGGFNLVHVGVRSDQEFAAVLAEAQRLGLMIIPEGGAARSGVSRFKDHPAVLAWNPGDEPDGKDWPPEAVAENVGQVKDADPGRPAYMTLCVPAKYDRYHRAADVLAPDPYPIPRQPIGHVAECIEKLQRIVRHDKPIWAIPQSFGGYSRWDSPTPAEERNMTYQCLVHGVRGLVYYTYWDGRFAMADHPELWAMMQRLAREAKALSPVLLAGSKEHYTKAGPEDKVHVMLKSHAGSDYLIAVNTTRDELGDVAVALPEGRNGVWHGLFGDPDLISDHASLALNMPALAVRVYRRAQ